MKCDSNSLNCPVDAILHLIGGKYKPLILWHLRCGTMRYGELQKLITHATPKMLTQQLRELEKDCLLNRTVFPIVPPKVEYSLTEMGRSLEPLLSAMYIWGADYLKNNGQIISCSMMLK